jgi:hypothetical protein
VNTPQDNSGCGATSVRLATLGSSLSGSAQQLQFLQTSGKKIIKIYELKKIILPPCFGSVQF